jgi:hypothetical protein
MENEENLPAVTSGVSSRQPKTEYFFFKAVGNDDATPEIESENTPKKLGLQVFRTMLIDEYNSTANLITKLFWPLCIFILVLIFHAEVRQVLENFSASLSRTSLIRIGDFEISISKEFFASDPEAFAIIQKLDQDEILVIANLATANAPVSGDNSVTFDQREKDGLRKLNERGLIVFSKIDEEGNSEAVLRLEDADKVEQTEMSKRVYEQLVSVLAFFVQDLPDKADSEE